MKILVVDDEVITLNILRKTVHWDSLGFTNIFTAMNAEDAKEILMTEGVDIALCDIELPGESGLDLIEWTQKIYPDILCIILTAYPDFNYARSAISLGVFEYILKPASADEIERVLRSAIDKVENDRLPRQSMNLSDEKDQNAVETVKGYIEQHYNDVITRDKIEKLVNLNRDYLNRIFKEETGYSLMEYIQYYRIIVAKKLLRETSLPVAEIGSQVGFDEPAYFTRAFRKWTEQTPGNYRKQYAQ